MKILDRKDAINHRQDERLIIVETAIHRVSCLDRTVFKDHAGITSNLPQLTSFPCLTGRE
ncbi:hypothetical protein [Nostoc sp.]|uniref:hypothetical protein n=1 Tax=Nostoc sp. TaxID=1180 RepID=UPI002FF510D0